MVSALLLSTAASFALANMPPPAKAAPSPDAKAQQAKAFVETMEPELQRLTVRSSIAEWIKATHITEDTERNAASLNEDLMGYTTKAIKESFAFRGAKLDADVERKLKLLRLSTSLPAPSDPQKRAQLATTAAKLEGLYGKGKWCPPGHTAGVDAAEDAKKCKDLGQLSEVLATAGAAKGASPAEQLQAWQQWHDTTAEMRPLYEQLVTTANEGAKEFGNADLGELWRSAYEMSPDAFAAEMERLWLQVKPLYDELHCYVRRRLSEKYGASVVSPTGPIPVHLLGNMWAQDWSNVYPLVEPYKGQPSLDVTRRLKAKKVDPKGLVRMGEEFFTSMGFAPLPATFWQRSLFTKPADREVVCHASAWDPTFSNDLRIKMCIKIDEEDFRTVHHELGHDYYFMNYYRLPMLYQAGANDGFHEAIGDALTLSITPEYLKKRGLIDAVPKDDKGTINVQMKDALDKVALLPWSKLVDQWRWDVFAGKTKPSEYNQHWWELRLKYQGVVPPGPRPETTFDPGAKYHVASNTPYARYFLARVLQYQFHRALCAAAGHQGPLHACSIYGSKAAGQKLQSMMALGASKPWPDALETLTGQRQLDASAMLDYFAPLETWLKAQNQGQKCGW